MQTNEELRNALMRNFEELEKGTRSLKLGRELANTAGKIISSAAVQLSYNQFMEKTEKIEFFENQTTELEKERIEKF